MDYIILSTLRPDPEGLRRTRMDGEIRVILVLRVDTNNVLVETSYTY
jgi:hypothetical protein